MILVHASWQTFILLRFVLSISWFEIHLYFGYQVSAGHFTLVSNFQSLTESILWVLRWSAATSCRLRASGSFHRSWTRVEWARYTVTKHVFQSLLDIVQSNAGFEAHLLIHSSKITRYPLNITKSKSARGGKFQRMSIASKNLRKWGIIIIC